VIAAGETLLGAGAHHYEAFDHAEIVALKQAASAGRSVIGATAYVTLEPCSHHGRTGPCADALIAAGIARVVLATVDPNPLVRGAGIAKLRAAGVEVCVLDASHPLAREARRLNDAFAETIQWGRPFITLKAAVSLDGKIAPPPQVRSHTAPHWLTGEAARADVQQLRHGNDAILTGIGTVLADDPSLTDRTGLPRRRPLLRIVLDSTLRTPITAKLLHPVQNDVLIVCTEDASVTAEESLRSAGADVLRLPNNSFDRPGPSALLRELGERRRILSLLLEGGSGVNGTFLQRNLVDKAVLYYADVELGAEGVRFAKQFPSPYVLQERLSQVSRVSFPNKSTEDIRIIGYIHDPWSGIS
jgi:diaminohydroxyphosphoribosylaminopyrimidine deaminase/5-amino-6-(5-phosphoribosylamino)uracil reductase